MAKEYEANLVEDLNLTKMSPELDLGKSTYDNGFGMFRRMLEYQLRDMGKQLIVVDWSFPSSKRCSMCGHKNAALRIKGRYASVSNASRYRSAM